MRKNKTTYSFYVVNIWRWCRSCGKSASVVRIVFRTFSKNKVFSYCGLIPLMATMSAIQTAKKAVRKELKKVLNNLSREEKYHQSEIIVNKLFQNKKFQESHRISVYLSRDIEVSTETIVLHLLKSGKECFIPKYDSKNPCMEMVKLLSVADYEQLPLTPWNIKQPADDDHQREEALLTGGLDLMIVPGIGFTKEGHRIGNGKGYYDLYIKRCNEISPNSVYTVALAFQEQMLPSIPVDKHDMMIDEVICPQ